MPKKDFASRFLTKPTITLRYAAQPYTSNGLSYVEHSRIIYQFGIKSCFDRTNESIKCDFLVCCITDAIMNCYTGIVKGVGIC